MHSLEDNPPKVRPFWLTRILFRVSSSPFLLDATIRHHLERYRESHPGLSQLLIDSFYVDDLTARAESEQEAHSKYTETKRILREGGFDL